MAGKSKVLMLLSNPFRPDPRVHREAESLVRAGYGVTVLCWDRDGQHPAEEGVGGISVKRLGPASGYGDAMRVARDLPKFWRNSRRAAAGMDFDIVHAHDLDTLSPGLKIAKMRKAPLIYDSHEIYHEMAGENLSPILTRFLAAYERRMARKPALILTVNEPIADVFRGFGCRDVRVVMNCQPDPKVDPAQASALRARMSPEGRPIALYVGVLEPNRLLIELAEAQAASDNGMVLAIGGFGSLSSRLAEIAKGSGGKVILIGKVSPSDVPAHNAAASVLLAAYDPALRNNRMGAPNKLFEAMAASRPIVVAEGTYASEVVVNTGCGLAARYDARDVLAAVSELCSDRSLHERCSSAGRKAFEAEYNWGVMEKRLLAAYSDLLGKGPD
jgi:glycosyltransferase involved in cell wall biosynthesis